MREGEKEREREIERERESILCLFGDTVHGLFLSHTATHCNTLQHTATHCNTLQHTASHRNVLQHNAMHHDQRYYSCATCSSSNYPLPVPPSLFLFHYEIFSSSNSFSLFLWSLPGIQSQKTRVATIGKCVGTQVSVRSSAIGRISQT